MRVFQLSICVPRLEEFSFRVSPSSEEYDLRITYCAFSICSMLDDWSIIDVEKALAFIQSCRVCEPTGLSYTS